MKVDNVRFCCYIAPPGSSEATVTELDAERDGIDLRLDGGMLIAEKAGSVCLYPVANCKRLAVSAAPKRRGRPPKHAG